MNPRHIIRSSAGATVRGVKNFRPALGALLFAGACAAAFPFQATAQEAEMDSAAQRGLGNFPFARMAQKAERSSGTFVLPGASEVLRIDGTREAGKEQNYWAIIRRKEEARLGAIYRAQMERDLRDARAKGVLVSASASGGSGTRRTSADPTYPARSSAEETAARTSELPATPVATARKPLVNSVGETLQRTANRIAETIEDNFYPQRTAGDPPSSVLVLALVAIFILPALAGVFVVLAYLSLRGGHRLQSGVFAAAGLVMAGVVAAAVFHRQAEPDREKLRAECAQLAITVTASTDRNGCAFLFTTDTASLPAGRTFTRVVYPAGSKVARNVFGLPVEMPAYTDSFEHALSLHAENAAGGSWWHKLLRPLIQS